VTLTRRGSARQTAAIDLGLRLVVAVVPAHEAITFESRLVEFPQAACEVPRHLSPPSAPPVAVLPPLNPAWPSSPPGPPPPPVAGSFRLLPPSSSEDEQATCDPMTKSAPASVPRKKLSIETF
jgi:hypothetical protein